jgi:6-phospho-3-hexuloisomerase
MTFSCTGQTGYTAYVAERARELGAKVAVVTGEPQSPVARCGDAVIVVPVEADDIVIRAAVFEHATSLCLEAVFNVLADRLKLDLQAYRERHANLE